MKINSINYNLRQSAPFSEKLSGESVFLFVKSSANIRVDGTEYACRENSVVYFRSGSTAEFRSASEAPLLCDVIRFRTSISDQQFISSLEIPMNCPVDISDGSVVQNLIRSLYIESERSGKRKNEFADYALKLIFIAVSEEIFDSTSKMVVNIPHYRKLENLRKSIYSSPAVSWNIDDICSSLEISRTYFHRIYYAAFGVTCMQDVINSRITFAGDMLANTGLSVSVIAEKCGYDSDSYFMRQFKKSTGYTPSEYRRLFSRTIKSSFGNIEAAGEELV